MPASGRGRSRTRLRRHGSGRRGESRRAFRQLAARESGHHRAGWNGLATHAGTDLVLQMHLQPTGKPEDILASVGFYFTDEPPTRYPTKLALRSTEIDIPPGEANYTIEARYTLPSDVRVIGLIPHAHYLGKQLEALAVAPDGTTEVLLRIPAWDFNWQGDYRFVNPPLLRRGTTLVQRFSYDNSESNVRNPNSPPQRVRYGLQSTDEMGELWFQVEPLTPAGRDALLADYGRRALEEIATNARRKLQSDPQHVRSLIDLGTRPDERVLQRPVAVPVPGGFLQRHVVQRHVAEPVPGSGRCRRTSNSAERTLCGGFFNAT
jgi:hypothetical protein